MKNIINTLDLPVRWNGNFYPPSELKEETGLNIFIVSSEDMKINNLSKNPRRDLITLDLVLVNGIERNYYIPRDQMR